MAINLYWIQCGGCGGDTMSFLCADSPDMRELFQDNGIELLWHPSLSNLSPAAAEAQVRAILADELALDVLVVEGAAVFGPDGTGLFDTRGGRPKKDFVAELAAKAGYVVAAGTCAGFGGFGAEGEIDSRGLQFKKAAAGGLLGAGFRSRAGMPVLNLPGCPVHPAVLSSVLAGLATGVRPPLDELNRPRDWYNMMVHQGCTRNEYHEYRVEDRQLGGKGCLFFHLGCYGPLVQAPCNKTLWNQRSSKTRTGSGCFGCTDPRFPHSFPFFQTRNIEDVPIMLPKGIDRAYYLAYKGMAAAAAPKRLKDRETDI